MEGNNGPGGGSGGGGVAFLRGVAAVLMQENRLTGGSMASSA